MLNRPTRPAGQIVTRFAPSPTGYLHIGGARTALFNWAFARRHGGVFILRIEDTDKARSTDAATRGIIEDMKWLGIDWDEGPEKGGEFGPYFQSERDGLYKDFLDRMVSVGRAYRCFKTQDQLKAEREAQKAAGQPMKYDARESLERSEADQQALIAAGRGYVWRFRMPVGESVTVNDLVLGDVTVKAEELEDFVIFKSDGGPTFHFANVVDDATMGVTHVLRAQEHLMNTPKHVAMFDALGIARPKYAHMPLIFNPDNTKMSKRDKAKTARAALSAWSRTPGNSLVDLAPQILSMKSRGPASVEELQHFLDKKSDDTSLAQYVAKVLGVALPEIDVFDFKVAGYLPSVILNYIALLGWSPGGNIERFNLDWFKENFSIDGIGKSNAKFDRAKLLAFNAATLQAMTPKQFADSLAIFVATRRDLGFEDAGAFVPLLWWEFSRHDLFDESHVSRFAEAYRLRSQTLLDPMKSGRFFITPDDAIVFDAKAVEKVLKKDGVGLKTLGELLEVFRRIETWEPGVLHGAIEEFAKSTGRGMGDVAQPLRVALTGNTVSPSIHDTLAILGKASSVARIERCLKVCG